MTLRPPSMHRMHINNISLVPIALFLSLLGAACSDVMMSVVSSLRQHLAFVAASASSLALSNRSEKAAGKNEEEGGEEARDT